MSNTPQPGVLTEWLKVMLGEVARKQEDAQRAAVEGKLRESDDSPSGPRPAVGKTS